MRMITPRRKIKRPSTTRMAARLGMALLGIIIGQLVTGCAITRTETDYYTKTTRDSTYQEQVQNVPGSTDDNGAVFPSSRTTIVRRQSMSHDSSYDRRYPSFLRMGGIELAGLMGTSSTNGLGTGLLGIYSLFRIPDADTAKGNINLSGTLFQPSDSGKQAHSSSIFKGLLLRMMPYEYRLRWFDDAPNWTLGSSLFEMLAKDEVTGDRLTSIGANIYLRRRFFIRDRIPYVIATPYFGLSLFPSIYANLGGELQLGSFGGFNLRGYVGYATGFTPNLTGSSSPAKSVSFPYIGLGVSALDFTNRPEETEREWKEYVHSAVEVKVLDITFINALAGYPNILDSTQVKLPITGLGLQLATAHFPLPIFNEHIWVGTSLINWMAFGFQQFGFSVLPIRAGYRQYIIAEDMSLEPFIEYNYYPSQFLNLGARLRLDTFSGFTFSLLAGYASGGSGDFLPTVIYSNGSDKVGTFATGYLGLSIGISDHLLRPEAVRALRDSKH